MHWVYELVGGGVGSGRDDRRGTSGSRSGWLTAAGSFTGFQLRVELGTGDGRDSFRLVTAAGRSRLGVADGCASGKGRAGGGNYCYGRVSTFQTSSLQPVGKHKIYPLQNGVILMLFKKKNLLNRPVRREPDGSSGHRLDRLFKLSNPGSKPFRSNWPDRTGWTGRSGPVFKTLVIDGDKIKVK